MEKHIFKKRQQYAKYISIRENRGRKEVFITPDFNKNYSNCNKMRPKVHILETSPSVYIGVLQQSAARIQVTITVTICAVCRTFNEVSAFPVR